MPEWVHQDPFLKKVDYLSNVEKRIPVADFSETFESSIKIDITNEIRSLIEKIDAYDAAEFLQPLLDQLKSFEYTTIKIPDSVRLSYSDDSGYSKTISFQKDTSLVKILQNLNERISKIDPYFELVDESIINDLLILNNKTDYSQEVDKVVFSTSPKDVLAMSSRSDWTSCQDLFKGAAKEQAIHAAINKYTGIIYVTSGSDYMGRGERMVLRSLVFYLVNQETGEKALHLPKVYPPQYNITKWKDFFKNMLEKHSGMRVLTADEINTDYVLPISDGVPYLDTKINVMKDISVDDFDLVKKYMSKDPNILKDLSSESNGLQMLVIQKNSDAIKYSNLPDDIKRQYIF